MQEPRNRGVPRAYYPSRPTENSTKTDCMEEVDVLVKQETRLEKIALLDNFLNSCGCGNINLRKSEFINHINTKHGGTVPPQSQINQPAWTHAVLFSSDEIEQLYCQTTVDLT